MNFKELNIIPPILQALAGEQYSTPTPVQELAIPPALAGRDLLGIAQTGTGKTAAFAVPTLQRLSAGIPAQRAGMPPRGGRPAQRPIRALVLTPTRELALQIHESFCAYGRYTPIKSCVIYGGVSQKPQEQALLSGPDILVATPGRLNDLLGQGLLSIGRIEILILDEADRMLDMGFIHDVRKIIALTPSSKQTLLFSATMPSEIDSLSRSLLHDPVRIAVTPEQPTVEKIRQRLYRVDKANKRHLLLHLLQDPAIESALVFTRTKHGADRVARDLVRGNIQAQAIHGNKSQNARQQALGNFKNRSTRVLVATDIAARGLDIDELTHVINFDLPDVPESYVHRIGRTGRAGHGGEAISFCDGEEVKLLRQIEKLTIKPIPRVEDHPFPPTLEPGQAMPEAPARPQAGLAAERPVQSSPARDSAPRRRRRGGYSHGQGRGPQSSGQA